MAMFGSGHQGLTLRALLQNPDLQKAPDFNKANVKVLKKTGSPSLHVPINSAFLGPNLWEKPNNNGSGDFDLEYMDLDEFLSENGIPVNPDNAEFEDPNTISLLADALTNSNGSHSNRSSPVPLSLQIPSAGPSPIHSPLSSPRSPVGFLPESPQRGPAFNHPHSPSVDSPSTILTNPKVSTTRNISKDSIKGNFHLQSEDFKISPQDLALVNIPVVYSEMLDPEKLLGSPLSSEARTPRPDSPSESELLLADIPGQDGFDAKSHKFTEEDLKPQPMIKKSRKVFVADDSKDDKYWSRRSKNNVAAKRSRDARRIKENQIAMRASFLENQNEGMKVELQKLHLENQNLQKRLAKYEKV